MKNKKKPSVDEHNKYSLFLALGLCISLGLSLFAFKFKTYNGLDNLVVEPSVWEKTDIEIVPITIQKPSPPPPVQYKIISIPDDEEPEIEFTTICSFYEDDILSDVGFEPIKPEETETPFIVTEEPATFPGGNSAWSKFLKKNLHYPRFAQKNQIEGRVFLSFIVDGDGNISDIKVTRGIGGGCDEEAERVLAMSPKWNAGKQRGRPVKAPMSISIVFKLK